MPDGVQSFGDDEPEDGWDRGDTVGELLDNLRRRTRLLDLRERSSPVEVHQADELDQIEMMLQFHARRRAQLDERAQLRVAQALEDVAYVRTRLRGY